MATLPSDNYVNQDTRTVAEMKTALEQMRDVTAEASAQAPQDQTISAGNLGTAPNAPLMKVKSEGFSTPAVDTLVTMNASGIDEGRIVILTNAITASNAAVTITHDSSGTANTIQLSAGADYVLTGTSKVALQKQGTSWVEVWRDYGDRIGEQRTDLGLGDAALRYINTQVSNVGMIAKVPMFGASVAAGAPLTLNSSGQLIGGSADGGDASTLDGLDSTEFVRKNPANQGSQTVAGNVTVDTDAGSRVSVNSDAGAATTGVDLKSSGVLRAAMTMATDTGLLDLMTQTSAGARDASVRLNQSTHKAEHYHADGSLSGTWTSLRPGAGNGLDADLVHGVSGSLLHNIKNMTFGGAGGSFKIHDGTSTYLIQWSSTNGINDTWAGWSTTGFSYSTPQVTTWTFPTAYPDQGSVLDSVHLLAGVGLTWDRKVFEPGDNDPDYFNFYPVYPVVSLDKITFTWSPNFAQSVQKFQVITSRPIVIGKVAS